MLREYRRGRKGFIPRVSFRYSLLERGFEVGPVVGATGFVKMACMLRFYQLLLAEYIGVRLTGNEAKEYTM